MATIKERIEQGKIEFKTVIRTPGKEMVYAFSHNYDPATGEQLDDTVSQLTVLGLENDLKNIDAEIEQKIALREETEQLMNAFKSEIEKAGKA